MFTRKIVVYLTQGNAGGNVGTALALARILRSGKLSAPDPTADLAESAGAQSEVTVSSSYPRRTSLLAAAVLGSVAVAAAGCSSGGSAAASATRPAAPTPQQVILDAAHTSQAATSIAGTISATVTKAGAGTTQMSGTTQERLRPSLLAELDITRLAAAGQSISGGMTEIITPSAFYMKSSMFPASATGGKAWVAIILSDLGASGSALQSLLSQAENSNPASQTQLLTASKDVKKVGTGTIGGVPVTEYTGSVALAQALAKLPANLRSQMRTKFTQSGLTTGRFKVWIDGQNQMRKMVITEVGTKVSETITVTVSAYNQPVTITVPPASQVYTLPASVLAGN